MILEESNHKEIVKIREDYERKVGILERDI